MAILWPSIVTLWFTPFIAKWISSHSSLEFLWNLCLVVVIAWVDHIKMKVSCCYLSSSLWTTHSIISSDHGILTTCFSCHFLPSILFYFFYYSFFDCFFVMWCSNIDLKSPNFENTNMWTILITIMMVFWIVNEFKMSYLTLPLSIFNYPCCNKRYQGSTLHP